MQRDVQFKYVGTLLLFAILLHLGVSTSGRALLLDAIADEDSLRLLATLGVLGVTLLTSEGMGFLLTSIVRMAWEGWGIGRGGGYSIYWTRGIRHDLRARLSAEGFANGVPSNVTPDVLLSYFWQCAPVELVQWASRRNTAMFLNTSSALALIIGTGGGGYFAQMLGWTGANTVILLLTILFTGGYALIARRAFVDGLQIIELWLLGSNNTHTGVIQTHEGS